VSTVILVRHAQASFGSDDYDRLSALGERQASLLGEYWAGLGQRLDAIYTGNMRRQIESARLVAGTLAAAGRELPPPSVLPEFDEFPFLPLLETHTRAVLGHDDWRAIAHDRHAMHRLFEGALHAWTRGELCAEGLEPWPHFKARCARGIEHVLHQIGRGRSVAVFSSAGAICAAVQRVLGLSDVATVGLKLTMYNCALTTLVTDGEKVSLQSFNGIPHLAQPGRAEFVTLR